MKRIILYIFTLLLCYEVNAEKEKGGDWQLRIGDDSIKIECNGRTMHNFVFRQIVDHLFSSEHITIGNYLDKDGESYLTDLKHYDATKNPVRTIIMLPSDDESLKYGYSKATKPVAEEKHKNFVKQYVQSECTELVGFIKKDNGLINFYLKLPQKINGKRVRIGIVASQKQTATATKEIQKEILKKEKPIYMVIEVNNDEVRTVHPIESLPE